MERDQEETQNLGFFGIYKESIRVINSWKTIFYPITLFFILPQSFVFLAHMKIAQLIYRSIDRSEDRSRNGGGYYYMNHDISSKWIHYWVFKATYLTLLLLFSLLSTAAVVYTIACIYTAQVITFKKVLKVIPKVWKRLFVTFLCLFFAFFMYNVVAGVIFYIWWTTISETTFGFVMYIVIIILYILGFIYMTIIWQIASVVTVLESHYGFSAMLKSKDLIKGKRWVIIGIFFTLNCVFIGLTIIFAIFVGYADTLRLWNLLLGIVCILLLAGLFLFALVIQTVIYLVCKSYHGETIDKLKLTDQLDGYLDDPAYKANNNNVQLGQTQGTIRLGQSQV